MENNKAGDSTHRMADKRYKKMIISAVIGVVIFIVLILLLNNASALGIGGGGILVLLFLVNYLPDFLDHRLGKREREVTRARRGARAEEAVDQLFAGLSEEYFLINDIDCPYGNIDHVLISKKGGIFLIETKSHYGKVSIQNESIYLNGHPTEKDFISQTLKNTYWLRDQIKEILALSVWVRPIIVFTNAFVPYGAPIKGITILNKKFLMNTIAKFNGQGSTNNAIWDKNDLLFSSLKKQNS
jgi:Nuclease-related domain.